MPNLSNGQMLLSIRVVNPSTGAATYARVRIDTGADTALISPALAKSIGVASTGTQQVVGVDGQVINAPVYVLDVDLGVSGYLQSMAFLGMDLSDLGLDGLFGDDLLNQGVLVRNGPDRSFYFVSAAPGVVLPQQKSEPLAVAILAGMAGLALLGAAIYYG